MGFNGRRPIKQPQKQQKAAAQTTEKSSKNNRKSSTSRSKLHKQQAQRAPNSSNTGKTYQKDQQNAAKEAPKAATAAAQTAAKAAAKRPEGATGGQTQKKLRAKWWRPRRVVAQRVGAQNLALFFLLPPKISLFVLSLRLFSWKFGGVRNVGALQNARLEFRGSSCASPGGPVWFLYCCKIRDVFVFLSTFSYCIPKKDFCIPKKPLYHQKFFVFSKKLCIPKKKSFLYSQISTTFAERCISQKASVPKKKWHPV